MDIVVKGHHVTVTDSFRSYVDDRITKLEKLEHRAIRVEVLVSAEHSKRQTDRGCRVEITVKSRGPIVRGEAKAEDKQAAFDTALDRIMTQLRKAADRKRIHHGKHTPISVAQATAQTAREVEEPLEESDVHTVAGMTVEGEGPLVVREKVHAATPMHLDQALHAMELVGHDFYLYVDASSQRPSVVYRRKGYDYGVIQLDEAAVEVAVAG